MNLRNSLKYVGSFKCLIVSEITASFKYSKGNKTRKSPNLDIFVAYIYIYVYIYSKPANEFGNLPANCGHTITSEYHTNGSVAAGSGFVADAEIFSGAGSLSSSTTILWCLISDMLPIIKIWFLLLRLISYSALPNLAAHTVAYCCTGAYWTCCLWQGNTKKCWWLPYFVTCTYICTTYKNLLGKSSCQNVYTRTGSVFCFITFILE